MLYVDGFVGALVRLLDVVGRERGAIRPVRVRRLRERRLRGRRGPLVRGLRRRRGERVAHAPCTIKARHDIHGRMRRPLYLAERVRHRRLNRLMLLVIGSMRERRIRIHLMLV